MNETSNPQQYKTQSAAALAVSEGRDVRVSRGGQVTDRETRDYLGNVWRVGRVWYGQRALRCVRYINDNDKCGRLAHDRCVQCGDPICEQHRTWWSTYNAWACPYPRHA